jgi:ABC-type nitrate/sulfonate/bicarbonate transport system ATPase subunit
MANPKVAAKGIRKQFGGHGVDGVTALDGVDFEAYENEFVSIVGPSGCGKSTLLDILAGLQQPTEGEVLLEGSRESSLLGRMGYMPQQDLLMPWRRLIDNTILGLQVAGQPKRVARERALQEFPRFGLQGFEHKYPAELSGGMRQRAALLRTFLAGQQVMLLDEPFGALDALTRLEMQEWLLNVWEVSRKCIIFVTHDVEEAIFLSDRIYAMSARPGKMALEIDVALSRPRTFELTTDDAFITIKAQLLNQLHGRQPNPNPGSGTVEDGR